MEPIEAYSVPTAPALTLDEACPLVHRFFLDRRRGERRPISGDATALLVGNDRANVRGRICSLQLLNLSTTGLAAVTQEPIAAGTQISVFIPPHGAEDGFDLHGTVVRCSARERGHHVAIRLHDRRAA